MAAVTAEREARVAAAVAAQPATARLSVAVTEAIVEQYTEPGSHNPRALLLITASVAAAVRIALQQWVRPAAESRAASELVIPSGSLPDLLRTALAPLAPALDAAERRPQQ